MPRINYLGIRLIVVFLNSEACTHRERLSRHVYFAQP
jgi:hypothetical protein